ncbi:nuclear transport factor 2 family protein [Streptomyces sp. NPDC020965]|uniref:nuclear transport factor 2 family protein n=1 Tax=Streptomyces sp. NPDC020965 TaxID=3365105 RepID=UPI0037B8B37D
MPEHAPQNPAVEAELVTRLIAAINAQDAQGAAAFYAEGFIFEDIALGLCVRDHRVYSTTLDAWLAAVPDTWSEARTLVACPGSAAATWVVTGTLATVFPGLPEGFVVGSKIKVRGASVFTFGPDMKITRHEDYYSLDAQVLQTDSGTTGGGA